MFSIIFSLLAGLGIGYLIIGPVNRSYSPKQYAGLVFLLAFTIGAILFVALILGGALDGKDVAPLGGLAIALVFWAGYSASLAVGAFIEQFMEFRIKQQPLDK